MKDKKLIFLHAKHIPRCQAEINKFFYGYHTLQYIDCGQVDVFYDQAKYTLHEGGFWPCFPGPRVRFHTAVPGMSWDHRYVAFSGEMVCQWERDGLLPRSPVCLEQPKKGSWAERMDEIIGEADKTGEFARLRAINLLENLLLSISESRFPRKWENPWLEDVHRELENQGLWPDYAKAAVRLCVSESTLRRRFRRLMGVSLHDYVIEKRLQTACSLLSSSDASLEEIAGRLGYRETGFFSRQFKARKKVTPGEFRKSLMDI